MSVEMTVEQFREALKALRIPGKRTEIDFCMPSALLDQLTFGGDGCPYVSEVKSQEDGRMLISVIV